MVKQVVRMKMQISLTEVTGNYEKSGNFSSEDKLINVYTSGFTYIGLLIMISIMSLTLALAGTLWSFAQQRQQEDQLIFIGNQYKHAIANYYQRTPGTLKTYPQTLQDLLLDNRYVSIQRHIRKLYPDPITGSLDWGLVVAPQGGVMGVYSQSNAKPIKVEGFKLISMGFENHKTYQGWKFVFVPPINNQNIPLK